MRTSKIVHIVSAHAEGEVGDVIVGDTHDEVICEVDDTRAWAFADQLDAVMVEGFQWSAGLPLAAETTVNWYYSKDKGMKRPR